MVARWGGEEFLWLSEMTISDSGPQQCNELQLKMKEMNCFRDSNHEVTCSIGYSTFPLIDLNFEDWEAALRLADYALYHSKHSGKNSWTGFNVMDGQIDYDDVKNVDGLVKNNRLQIIKKSD